MLERLEDLVASSESLPVATMEFGSRCPEIGQVFNSHPYARWWWWGKTPVPRPSWGENPGCRGSHN